ncbi:SDR family oxidoreductase [Bradyrhizobium ivorense]|uniref:SDR family oxidoreductase n=1 Tax=Bradyrhizobium ivorense TaxID=2511166 RepID=UPI001E4CA473|nr:SDR family oxidoreductase [Bradyrhizobium ivorense]
MRGRSLGGGTRHPCQRRCPGYIETVINVAGRTDRSHYQRIADRTALKRWGQPEDTPGAVVFLCMPASQYATGTILRWWLPGGMIGQSVLERRRRTPLQGGIVGRRTAATDQRALRAVPA